MKAKFLIPLLLVGEALAAELPAPFHHVRIASSPVEAAAAAVSLKTSLKIWLEGPTEVKVGASKQIHKHFDFSWTTSRYGLNERFPMTPGNAAQHWSAAAKIQFRF